MKSFLVIILFGSLLMSSAFASACSSEASDRDLFALFYVDDQPTTWRSVVGSTTRRDRGVRITVNARNSVASSTIEFQGRTYGISQVHFCNSGGSKITVTHPEHGEMTVQRRGRGERSIITLKRNALLIFKLRPLQYTVR